MQRAILFVLWALAPVAAQVAVDPPFWQIDPPLVAGESATRRFDVLNRGKTTVRILKVTADKGLVPGIAAVEVAPGEQVALKVQAIPGTEGPLPRRFQGKVRLALDSPQTELVFDVIGDVVDPDNRGGALPAAFQHGHYAPRPGDIPVQAEVFYNSNCSHCVTFMRLIAEPLEVYYGPWLKLTKHDLREPAAYRRAELLKRGYGLSVDANTYFFCGRWAYASEEIDRNILRVIDLELRQPSHAPSRVAVELSGGALLGDAGLPRPSAFSFAALVSAGALDGLNPCAFATAVFLIALLTRLGHDKRTLVLAGLAYAGAVYVTYTLLGLGVLRALAWFGDRLSLANGLRLAVALLAFGFALAQLWDVLRLSRGAPTRELSMQLPHRLKQWIHTVLRVSTKPSLGRALVVLGAVTSGAAVTLVEMVCTSQVYVPILIGLQTPTMRGRALPLLLTYNVGFVAPLLLVIALAWRGVTSERLAQFARRHLLGSKLALALLLAALATWLMWPEVRRFLFGVVG